MKTFNVLWEIEIDAETKEEAAKKALEIQRDPNSTATIFIIEGTNVDADLLEDKDIYLLYEGLSKDEQINILYSAIDYMHLYNGRSKTTCIALALGYDIYPTGGYYKVAK